MSGGVAVTSSARVRIKGHAASVIRFFLISNSFMLAWVVITSELGYYSRWFGPQILLELSLAFYLPSIPVLFLLGQVEKFLDGRVGSTKSMAIRLITGLGGGTICAAAFPFLPNSQRALLCMVAVLGTLSGGSSRLVTCWGRKHGTKDPGSCFHAIAFSTSYQLVQWFRHSDVIGLGLGGVGTGTIALVMQAALAMGPNPQRWKWVAMFEITAGLMALGVISAASLFAQYGKIMSGQEEYVDPRTALLGSMEAAGLEEHDADAEEEEGAMQRTETAAKAMMLTPDPFHGAPALLSSGRYRWVDEDDQPPVLRRSSSTGSCLGAVQHTKAGMFSKASIEPYGRCRTADPAAHYIPRAYSAHTSASIMQTPGASKQGGQGHEDVSGAVAGSQGATTSGSGSAGPRLTVQQETQLVFKQAWEVFMAFLASVTVLYAVFPFFTFAPSSGWLGPELPHVLFFARIFADIIGRFAPRRRSLLVKSPRVLFTMACSQVAMASLFFVYIKVSPIPKSDIVCILLVIAIWLLGGYLNTCSNILAPSLVDSALVPRASALLALIFQVAHFTGLLLAVLLAWCLYGEVVA